MKSLTFEPIREVGQGQEEDEEGSVATSPVLAAETMTPYMKSPHMEER